VKKGRAFIGARYNS